MTVHMALASLGRHEALYAKSSARLVGLLLPCGQGQHLSMTRDRGIEPHWARQEYGKILLKMQANADFSVSLCCCATRSLLLKHHQWRSPRSSTLPRSPRIALKRRHAIRLVDPKALAAANEIFESEYLGEPLCSDEVFPLLTLAVQGRDQTL